MHLKDLVLTIVVLAFMIASNIPTLQVLATTFICYYVIAAFIDITNSFYRSLKRRMA